MKLSASPQWSLDVLEGIQGLFCLGALAVCTKAEREQVLVLGALQLVHLK